MCGKRESLTANDNDWIRVSLNIIRAPSLWKWQTSEARRICAANESTLSTADAVPLPHAGKAYKVSQSPVIPLISGEWIVSHVWHEILRLSPHLFWLGLFTHRAFSSAQDDDT